MEGDRARIAATCLPRKGKAGHWREGGEQTWQQTGAASAAWDVTPDQLPPRGPCRHTWPLSSGFDPGCSQLKIQPYGGRLFGKAGPSKTQGNKVTEERLAVSRAWSPGTHPRAARCHWHAARISLPVPPLCPPPPRRMASSHIKSETVVQCVCVGRLLWPE